MNLNDETLNSVYTRNDLIDDDEDDIDEEQIVREMEEESKHSKFVLTNLL